MRLSPDDIIAHSCLGLSSLQLGQADCAYTNFQTALQLNEKAILAGDDLNTQPESTNKMQKGTQTVVNATLQESDLPSRR